MNSFKLFKSQQTKKFILYFTRYFQAVFEKRQKNVKKNRKHFEEIYAGLQKTKTPSEYELKFKPKH